MTSLQFLQRTRKTLRLQLHTMLILFLFLACATKRMCKNCGKCTFHAVACILTRLFCRLLLGNSQIKIFAKIENRKVAA